MPSDILIDRQAATSLIRINRPEVRNACRAQTLIELVGAIRAADADPSLRAVILTGAGDKAFCAGADLREMAAATSPDAVVAIMTGWWDLIETLRALRKPVIAAVRGFAVGGGTEIVLACHITLAGETARFGLSEIRHGHLPGAAGTALLPRQIGYGPAAYHLLTGDEIPAREAERLGLIARVVADAALDSEATALAARLAQLSPAAVAAMLTTLVEGRGLPVAEAIELERKVCAGLRGTPDFVEGIRAFVEKRTPRYGDRRMSDAAGRGVSPPRFRSAAPETIKLDDTGQGGALIGGRCRECGTVTFAPQPICPGCWKSATQDECTLSPRGRLYAYTIVRHLPPGATAPYAIAYVDLPEQLRVMVRGDPAQLAAMAPDSEVEIEIAPIGADEDGTVVLGPVLRGRS